MDRERQLQLIDRIMAHRAAGTTDLAEASYRNPVSQYTDPFRLDQERQLLFRRTPVLACMTADVREPGDYVTLDVDDVPVLVVRGGDGVVRAFRNVCRHRGACVADGRGNSPKVFTCPYHSWSYDHGGTLVSLPGRAGFADVDRSTMGLSPLACGEAHGFVCIRLEGDGPVDVDEWLCGAQVDLAPFGLEGWHHVETRFNRRRMNWKLMVDTFCEAYHIQSLHRSTIAPTIMSSASLFDGWGPHGRMTVSRWSVSELDDQPRDSWDTMPHVTLVYVLMPNVVLIYQQDHVELWQIFPHGTDESSAIVTLYAPEPADTERAQKRWKKAMDLLLQVTDTEDFIMCEQIQISFRSGAQDAITFGRNEPTLIHFHRSLDQQLGVAPLTVGAIAAG
jgi:phenylpropionate dioxygenase-like ring-hydroxylating dioxygenase large terminal subunit